MNDPYAVENGLVFYLKCADKVRKFLLSSDALLTLRQRHGYVMDPVNLYRAHEAIVHLVARFLALGDRSSLPILIDTGHLARFDENPQMLRYASRLQIQMA